MSRITDRSGRPVLGQQPAFVEALVVDNRDPDKLGRVKLKFPMQPSMPESTWARVASPMAGRHRGWATIPEVGDEVLVSFMHGDIQHGVVIGGLHNGVDTTPYANEDGRNDLRVFQSRAGHRLTFDDKAGAERIELVSHNEGIHVILDTATQRLTVFVDGDIEISAQDHYDIRAEDIHISASGNIDIEAGEAMVLDGGSASAIVAGGGITLQAPDVLIN